MQKKNDEKTKKGREERIGRREKGWYECVWVSDNE
jgi:hypothetical protein